MFCSDVIKGPLLFAKFRVPTLFSQSLETLEAPFNSRFILEPISSNKLLAATSSLIPWESAMYSASRVDRAISDCNFELQRMGTPPKFSSKPLRLLSHTGLCLFSATNKPAKSASANKSNFKFFELGVRIIPLSLVPCKYRAICFNPTSWQRRGLCENLAH